uniref:VWFA domain-containing protein n=1 Tax=Oncorhynchus tshawytscha TaxID=74940 RepID=A0A8C8IC64_ONCTS
YSMPGLLLCKGKPLDFVFIIDSSRSVRPSDYEKVKIFITNILAFLDVGPEATRVGLLQYGSVVQNEFSLNTYSSKADVERAVKAMDHLATGTMTGLAIQYTMETAFTEPEGARPADMHIPRIAMIITDGRPQDTVEEVAAKARQAGIQIFAIGVGRVDMNTLRVIGSEPHSEHVYLVANFSQIETLTSVFQSNLLMDLVFVIDGSKSLGPANFELVKQFVNGIVDSLDVSGTGTHVGLLQYSSKVRTEFILGQYTSGRDINRAVLRMQYMGRGSMTGAALRHMFEYSFSAKEGARPDIPRVSIVFTDGRSQDDVSKWATKAKDAGIMIYALGVGKAIEEELREIASEPDDKHLYYAEDFSNMGEITDKLKSQICKDMCKCENVMLFQRQVNEQLRRLTQNNILYSPVVVCIL